MTQNHTQITQNHIFLCDLQSEYKKIYLTARAYFTAETEKKPLFSGDGSNVFGGWNLHPRFDNQCDRGPKRLRRYGGLIICRIKHFRRHSRVRIHHLCRVLGISNIGAKCDFEIWGLKGFLSLDKKNSL